MIEGIDMNFNEIPSELKVITAKETDIRLEGDKVIITPDGKVTVDAKKFTDAIVAKRNKIKEMWIEQQVEMPISNSDGYPEFVVDNLQIAFSHDGYRIIRYQLAELFPALSKELG